MNGELKHVGSFKNKMQKTKHLTNTEQKTKKQTKNIFFLKLTILFANYYYHYCNRSFRKVLKHLLTINHLYYEKINVQCISLRGFCF